MPSTCGVEGCRRVVRARGLCGPHYVREQRADNPEKFRERDRKRYAENPNKRREIERKRYEENSDKIKARIYKYRLENIEKVRETDRRYRLKNLEKRRESLRKWQAANIDKLKEYYRVWRAANPDKDRKSQLEWRKKNKEKRREYMKEWTTANSDAVRAGEQRRRARERQAPGNFTKNDWRALVARSPVCYWCKKPWTKVRRPTHDHVIPLVKGGANSPENSVCACGSCNARKHASLFDPISGQGILL